MSAADPFCSREESTADPLHAPGTSKLDLQAGSVKFVMAKTKSGTCLLATLPIYSHVGTATYHSKYTLLLASQTTRRLYRACFVRQAMHKVNIA